MPRTHELHHNTLAAVHAHHAVVGESDIDSPHVKLWHLLWSARDYAAGFGLSFDEVMAEACDDWANAG